MIHEQWLDEAYCRQHDDPDLWFPVSLSPNAARRALQLCRTLCPVQRECAALALRQEYIIGIWAGVFISHKPNSQREGRQKLKLIAEGKMK